MHHVSLRKRWLGSGVGVGFEFGLWYTFAITGKDTVVLTVKVIVTINPVVTDMVAVAFASVVMVIVAIPVTNIQLRDGLGQ